ncbi:hypothetical protein QTO34_017405 [Cnephaeus nilssonii]|uniref:PiggyBac transposable element-derived protein domain-containing protein n=1 Tax=Cnephaeus nilssonii TaxID=3371016 RepID=A0AA40I114_CNENI|nr:hypothetical protein QTO34_017405 [Eptesicus nilssonii]
MLCESKTGYICNMEIYTGEGKKLNDSILSLLQPYLELGHHIHQDNCYNSDKREVRIISTIHDASSCKTEKTNRHTGEEIKKPVSIVQYNNCMQGVDLADQYLSTYSIHRKTIKWTKKVVLYLVNCGLFKSFRIYQVLNPESQVRYKDFLLTVATEWISSQVDKCADPEFSSPNPSDVRSTRAPQKDHP